MILEILGGWVGREVFVVLLPSCVLLHPAAKALSPLNVPISGYRANLWHNMR